MRRFAQVVAIIGGAISAASCASFGASSEPTPAPTADAGPAAAEGGTEAGANVDGGAPLDAQPGTPLQCPASAILCDTFEDRGGATTNLLGTSWGEVLPGAGTGRIDDAMSFSPAHSLAITVPTGTKSKTVGLQARPKISGTGVTLRAAVRLSALTPYAQLVSMVADAGFFAFIVNNGVFVVQYRDGANATAWAQTTTSVPVDQWFNVTFELRFGPTGGVRVLLDGAPLYEMATAATTPATTVADFRLIVDPDFGGTDGTATPTAITIHYDDIVLE